MTVDTPQMIFPELNKAEAQPAMEIR